MDKDNLKISCLLVLLFCLTSCFSSQTVLSDEKDLPHDWTTLQIGNDVYFARLSRVPFINECLGLDNANPCGGIDNTTPNPETTEYNVSIR